MRVAILQSSYIPWKGYFDIINMADLFIFYDNVQFTVRDWRNRNLIKTNKGVMWLTVPCGEKINSLIYEIELKDNIWQKKHWRSISYNYKRALYFKKYSDFFEDFYLNHVWTNLSDMNQYLIKKIATEILSFTTLFDDSRNYDLEEVEKASKVLEILEKAKATSTIIGPSAKNYLDDDFFEKRNIKVTWMDYSGYPEYRQLYPPFVHEVSIIDLIFNEGPNARKYLKSTI